MWELAAALAALEVRVPEGMADEQAGEVMGVTEVVDGPMAGVGNMVEGTGVWAVAIAAAMAVVGVVVTDEVVAMDVVGVVVAIMVLAALLLVGVVVLVVAAVVAVGVVVAVTMAQVVILTTTEEEDVVAGEGTEVGALMVTPAGVPVTNCCDHARGFTVSCLFTGTLMGMFYL